MGSQTQQVTREALAGVATLDGDGCVLSVNATWQAFECAGDDWVGSDYFAICARVAGEDAGSGALVCADAVRRILAGDCDDVVVTYACDDPLEPGWCELSASGVPGDGPTRAVLRHQDVTARETTEQSAAFRLQLLDNVDASVIALDPAGVILEWNRGAERLYGWTADEALGHFASDLLIAHPGDPTANDAMERMRRDGRWEGDVVVRRKDDSRFPAHVRNTALRDDHGVLVGFVGVSVDITERRNAERAASAARDYMRAVADSMGDALCTLDSDGRIVYLNPRGEELLGWAGAELAGADLHEALHHTHADGTAYPAGECPLVRGRSQDGPILVEDDVLVRRDGSLLPVRQVQTPFGRGDDVDGYVLVFSDISDRKRREVDAATELRELTWLRRVHAALDEDRFVLHAQPIVRLDSGEVTQHELLIRMIGDDGQVIAPCDFLPVAEAYGLIGELDRWVIRQAAVLATHGRVVELNVSAHSLSDPTLFDHLETTLRQTGADPALLVFELTETALLHDETAALTFVSAIKRAGCRFALDDFGTGYGGFSYLKRLPVDYLKIDTDFVRDLTSEPASRQVVEAVVHLARGFRIETIAEGVEDEETLALLRELGVDYAQGYHLGRPALISGSQRKAHT